MSILEKPLKLPCGAILKNRIAKAAMTEGLADARNRATPRHVAVFRRWADGGAGLLITGNVMVDRRYLERPGNIAIDGPQDEAATAALSALAHAGGSSGAAIWMQLSHAGRQTPRMVAKEPVAPSAVDLELPGKEFAKPRALGEKEIEDVVARFAAAAMTAKAAGFSGVQIHAAHGYLISEFLSPRTNRRDDGWGGSLENRARLLLRVVASVRARVGSGYPVSVKLNSSDFQKGGFSFEDCLQVVEWLNRAGIDLLEISGGSYEQPRMMGMDGLTPPVDETVRETTRAREAYFVQYAEKVARVARMPLMVTGGFRTRAGMESAIEDGAAAVIGLARPLCIEPDLPKRLIAGAQDEAPSLERGLQLGRGVLGPNSKYPLVKLLNGFGAIAFFYENIYRLADGLEPKRRLPFLRTFLKYRAGERRAAKALVR